MVVISRIAKKKEGGYKKIATKYYDQENDKWVDDIDKATLYSKTDALLKTNELDGGYIYSLVFDVDFQKIREQYVAKKKKKVKENDENVAVADTDKKEDAAVESQEGIDPE